MGNCRHVDKREFPAGSPYPHKECCSLSKYRVTWFVWLYLTVSFLASPSAWAGPSLRVGIYSNNPKVSLSDSGKAEGIFIDLIEAIAAQEGWNLVYVPGTWAQGLDRLATGEIDLMPDVALTREREAVYAFHREPVLSDWFQVFARRGSRLRSLLDLNGKRVSLLDRSIQEDAFKKASFGFDLKVTLLPMPDYSTAFTAVAQGKVDAVISNRFYGAAHVRHYQLEDTAIIFNPTELYFAAPKSADPVILDAIDRHLKQFKSDPMSLYYKSLRRWTSEEVVFQFPPWLKVALSIAAVLLFLSSFWSIMLRHQVAVRTRDLALRNEQLQALYEKMKYAEKALRESELKHRILFEMANDAIMLIRGERFIDCNARTLKMFGCSREQIAGMTPYEYSPLTQPDGRSSREKAMEKINLALTVGPQFYEWEHCRRDGTHFIAEISLNRMELDGEPLLQAIIRDITARKKSEEALRQSEATIVSVFRAAPVGICIMKDRVYRSANKFWCEKFGYSEESIIGRTTRMLYECDEEWTRVGGELYGSLQSRGLASVETRLRCSNGSFRSVILTAALIQQDDLSAGTVVIIHDITEQKQA